jgi:pimeloyl-ACP methyl ester carboxylesterase
MLNLCVRECREHKVMKHEGIMKRILLLAVLVWIISIGITSAQDITPQPVEAAASDGLALKGDFYTTGDIPQPAVLLLHMNGSNRQSWEPVIPDLVGAGYAVLTVDLRGFGETGGSTDWEAATTDVQTWLDWLRTQSTVRPEAISIMGASIGSNLALVGCAADEACVTAIAISPGLDYFGVQPLEAATEGLEDRSALLIAAQRDSVSRDALRAITQEADGEIGVQLYDSSMHGTPLFNPRRVGTHLRQIILAWLQSHTPEPE